MEKSRGISANKEKNFSEWYTQTIQKADLADYSSVKGCMIIKPAAYFIWERIQEYFNGRLKKLGVRNAYFPLFIPESFFKKEAEHAEGFKPEVAWLANVDGERLAIRPTSETVIYDSYSRWIRSYRDLPMKMNQWANVVRWETKATRLFLRTREFLWQEGHCVYETKEECDKETLLYLKEYKKLCEELLAIPVIMGKKSEKEKFAGALYTTSIDSLMPDGRALQMGTSHNLGQGFAKSFNIIYIGKDKKEHLPWQNSWGVSTRLIGALVMVHGDSKGVVLPPRVAYNKVVVIPILFDKSEQKVLKKAEEISSKLRKYNAILDSRREYTPGWKFNDWELRGIPIRIEIGPRDLDKKQVILVRRDTNEKKVISIKNLYGEVKKTLESMQKNLLERAKKALNSRIVIAEDWSEFDKSIKGRKLVLAPWCNTEECEDMIREKSNGAKSITMPFDQPKKIGNKCLCCGKDSKAMCLFAKSY